MPFLDVNGTRLYYEDTGGSGEPVVFSHGLLWSGRMFDKQVAGLKSGDPEPLENVPKYKRLNFIARWFGLGLVASRVMKLMFGRTFLEDPVRAAERAEWTRRLKANRRDIWRAVNGVIRRRGVYEELSRIKTPTLILVGEEDVATVPAKAERLHGAIEGSTLVKMPRGGHTSTVEEPELGNPALMRFLEEVSSGTRQAG